MRKLACLFVISLFLGNCSFAQIENPVSWSFTSEPGKDGTFNLKFKATMQSTWHLYSQHIPENGPVPTSFKFEENKNYEVVGKVKELSKVISFYDKSFEMEVKYFGHEALFVQKIKIKSNEAFKVKGSVEYMCCNDQKCLSPKSVDFEFSIPKTTAQISKPQEEVKPQVDTQSSVVIGRSIDSSSKSKVDTAKVANFQLPVQATGSLWSFFFLAFAAGFIGLLTPCVYPMIPMTVSFFMQSGKSRSAGIFNGLIFGASIIFIYTMIGVIVALTKSGPGVTSFVSTHWIPNVIFFLLFLLFSISFLGLFELVLPSSWSTKIDNQVDKGGIQAPFFMALTLVIVSFSCTIPFVSSILVEASNGEVLKPVIGMLGYSSAFAIPFVIFALSPVLLKKLSKSGAWLNSVKVAMAFVLLAFSLKFIASIDQAYHLNLLPREVFIIIWVVLSLMLGLYLLGKLKFKHDSDLAYIGVFRFLFIVVTFSFSIYLLTGLVGNPLKSLGWILPPKSSYTLTVGGGLPLDKISDGLCGTPKYADKLELPYNLKGYFDYDEGVACAKQMNKPILLDFKGHFCSNCKEMESQVWSDPKVLQKLKNDFIIIALYTDDKTKMSEKEWVKKPDGQVLKRMGEKNLDFEETKFKTNTQPLYAIIDGQGKVLNNPMTLNTNIEAYLKFLKDGKDAFDKGIK